MRHPIYFYNIRMKYLKQHLKQLKHLKHKLATCLKTPETLETQRHYHNLHVRGNAVVQASPSAGAGLPCLLFRDGRVDGGAAWAR
jgi:hypothetical protein